MTPYAKHCNPNHVFSLGTSMTKSFMCTKWSLVSILSSTHWTFKIHWLPMHCHMPQQVNPPLKSFATNFTVYLVLSLVLQLDMSTHGCISEVWIVANWTNIAMSDWIKTAVDFRWYLNWLEIKGVIFTGWDILEMWPVWSHCLWKLNPGVRFMTARAKMFRYIKCVVLYVTWNRNHRWRLLKASAAWKDWCI